MHIACSAVAHAHAKKTPVNVYPRVSVEWSSTVKEIYLIDVFHSVIGQECLSLLK